MCHRRCARHPGWCKTESVAEDEPSLQANNNRNIRHRLSCQFGPLRRASQDASHCLSLLRRAWPRDVAGLSRVGGSDRRLKTNCGTPHKIWQRPVLASVQRDGQREKASWKSASALLAPASPVCILDSISDSTTSASRSSATARRIRLPRLGSPTQQRILLSPSSAKRCSASTTGQIPNSTTPATTTASADLSGRSFVAISRG